MTGFTRQLARRTVSGYVNVLGEATNTASVSVNTNLAYRKDRYFRAELSVDNTAGPVWLGITNVAVMPVGGGNYVVSNVTGNVFVPKTPESFDYDDDGNLTSDGRWTYTWDAENRLVKVESRTTTPLASRRKVEWQFDALGRRIRQTTSDGSTGAWQVTEDLKFVSDPVLFGRHIAELNATNNALVRSYVLGLDLSGSLDGAGGVGGLLWGTSAANGAHFYACDGNGNIVALVKATDGTVSAHYEYEPFGAVLRATGPMADENAFGFSTKRTHRPTRLVLYEFRPYDPDKGRWPNRDPIGEQGGPNIYGFVYNDPVGFIDLWGLECQNIFNFGLGGSWNVAPGIFGAWDFDVNVDKCDRWSSPATIEGCGYCYRVHVKAGAEIGVGAKFYWKRSFSILGFGGQAALNAEFSLAKIGANGETTVFICKNPLGWVVGHDSSVVRLVELTVGPTASVSASGGLHAGNYVNINIVGEITAYANLHATLGIKVVSYGSHGNIQAVGSFTGNVGFKADLYARGNVLGSYFDWRPDWGHIDWTLFDKPGWAEEELGRLWSW